MNIVIDKELQSRIPPLSDSEFSQLEKNIIEYGCRDPLVIWPIPEYTEESTGITFKYADHRLDEIQVAGEWRQIKVWDAPDGEAYHLDMWPCILIDGHNRHEICTKHNIEYKTKTVELENKEQALEWIDKNQIGRRNLHPEAFRLILGRIYNRTKKPVPNADGQNQYSEVERQNDAKAKTSEIIAADYSVSARTVERAGKAEEEVRGSPLETDVLAGKARLNEAAELTTAMREIEPEAKTYTLEEAREKIKAQQEAERERKKAEREKAIAEQMKKNPEKAAQGNFELVLADPPWQYDFSQSDSRHLDNHYPTTGVEDIIKHKPQTADNCVLLLWATVAKLPEAFEVMKEWGFEYKTNAVWDKEKIGMGYWFRGQHELLLVGTKGTISPPEQDKRVSSVFIEPRGKHSKKPECVYQWIEEAFPHLAKLEMYCRDPRDGWTAWGNEV